MTSAVSPSMAGLSAAFQRFDGAASRVASPEAAADPTRAVVDTVQAKFDVARLHAHGLWATMQKDA